jgi:hypothetical protein
LPGITTVTQTVATPFGVLEVARAAGPKIARDHHGDATSGKTILSLEKKNQTLIHD